MQSQTSGLHYADWETENFILKCTAIIGPQYRMKQYSKNRFIVCRMTVTQLRTKQRLKVEDSKISIQFGILVFLIVLNTLR